MEQARFLQGEDAYLPFFYIIWSDDLLSASETEVVRAVLKRDQGISEASRTKLLSWLNRESPPTVDHQKQWLDRIRKSGARYTEEAAYPLSAFGRAVAAHFHPGEQIQADLEAIEANLGIQPNHYRHLFRHDPGERPSYYDPRELSRRHLGDAFKAYREFRAFLETANWPSGHPRDNTAHRKQVSRQLRELADRGFGALAFPEAYGGNSDMESYAAIFENLMFVDGSLCVKFGVQFGLFGGSIQKLGNEEHHKAYLKKAGTLELPGCFAMTETMHGSNVRGIRTTATYLRASEELVVHTPGPNDNKEYIGNALEAKMATVFAQLIVDGASHGVHAILVPLRDDNGGLLRGVRIEDNGHKLGLNGVDNGMIWFREVRVPARNLLDRYGGIGTEGAYQSPIESPNKRFFTMLGTLVGGRICVGKGALAGAKMALCIAVKYALKRRQFNDDQRMQEDLIMDFPSHQIRLIPALASCFVYQAALDDQMKAYMQISDGDTRKSEAQVAGLKAIVTHFANATIQECREACGGKGYLSENRIGDLKSDVDIFTTFEGDNTVLLQLAAKGRLTDFKTEFNADDFFGVLRLLSTQLARRWSAINPAYVNKTDREHLFDPAFHQHALGYRTQRLTYTLALRIRGYIRKGMPSYQAFLKVQTHLIALGKAYSEDIAYAAFRRQVETMEADRFRNLFDKLGTLHALNVLSHDASWYMQQGYFGKNKSKAVQRRVERLCSELRPHVGDLVEGFGIPESLIRKVPICN